MSRSSNETEPRHGSGGDRFAVVIPVYNHHATVAKVVRKARQYGFPVVVVDDGSSDATMIIYNQSGIFMWFDTRATLAKARPWSPV